MRTRRPSACSPPCMSTEHMMRQQDMHMDIEYWVEELGYADVLDALIDVCQYWATQREASPPEGPHALWAQREHALRQAQWEAS